MNSVLKTPVCLLGGWEVLSLESPEHIMRMSRRKEPFSSCLYPVTTRRPPVAPLDQFCSQMIQTYIPVGGTPLWFENNYKLLTWDWSHVEPAVVYFLGVVLSCLSVLWQCVFYFPMLVWLYLNLRYGNMAYHCVFRMLLWLSFGVDSPVIGISGSVGTLHMHLCL